MNGSFGYDVGVEPVAEIDRVDIVTGIAAHVSILLLRIEGTVG